MIKQIIRKLFIETSDDKLRKLSEGRLSENSDDLI